MITQAYHQAFGTIPDFTYGVGQLRFHRAKEILNQRFPTPLADEDVFALLENECDNASLVVEYISELAAEAEKDETISVTDPIETVVKMYIGSTRETESSRHYVQAVRGAYQLIDQQDKDTTPEAKDAPTTAYIC
jgi:hypothetical protein